MMRSQRIAESELIINAEGRIYHLNLKPDMVADTIIVVGDPDRVGKVSQYFDKVLLQVNNRELVTHTGELGGKLLTVMSSGMGSDNVELLMTELDALVNIDFETRRVKKKLKKLNVIRIGTSGCIQADIPIDSILTSKAALGLDTLSSFYQRKVQDDLGVIESKVQRLMDLPFKPYIVKGSESMLRIFEKDTHHGVTITAPGFYAPQGRKIRLPISRPTLIADLAKMNTSFGRFTNLEMETAAYYMMAELLGHEMISLNALIANRVQGSFSDAPEMVVDRLIQLVLSKIV